MTFHLWTCSTFQLKQYFVIGFKPQLVWYLNLIISLSVLHLVYFSFKTVLVCHNQRLLLIQNTKSTFNVRAKCQIYFFFHFIIFKMVDQRPDGVRYHSERDHLLGLACVVAWTTKNPVWIVSQYLLRSQEH